MKKKEPLTTLHISAANSYFGELLTMLLALNSYILTSELIHKRRSPILEIDDPIMLNNMVEIPFEGLSIKKLYSFKPISVIKLITQNQPIERIEINEYTIPSLEEKDVSLFHWVEQQYDFNQKIIGAGFISYYESIKGRITSQFTENPAVWPPELNFARIVRNAFAHGGKITFINPNSDPVSWKGLTYSPEHNGHIIYQDIFMVEIIDLFQVIEAIIQ